MQTPSTRQQRLVAISGFTVAGILALTACASADDSSTGPVPGSSSTSDQSAAYYDAAVAAATAAAEGEELSGSISVLGINTGDDAEALQSVMKPFTDATGVTVEFTGVEDQGTAIASALEAGTPPDIIDGQGAGLLAQYAPTGDVLSLSDVIGDDVLAENYGAGLLSSTTYDGTNYGIWGETDTFSVWYNTATYDGPTEADTTYADFADWVTSEGDSDNGVAPWCMALGTAAFPAYSWIEETFVKMWGPEKLQEWANGDLSWTSPEVKAAFERFGEVATSDTLVNGGPQAVVSTPFFSYTDGMFSDPQQCQLTLWGNYMTSFVQGTYPDVSVPDDLSFFALPADDAAFADAEVTTGHVMWAFEQNDRPEVRAFLRYWASAEAQTLNAATGRWTVGNSNVPIEAYPANQQPSAELLQASADNLVVGPAGAQSSAVQAAWGEAVIAYIQDPSSLDDQLASIQAATGE